MQDCITAYCSQGGNIFISGAYVGTDLWDNRLIPANEEDKKFATEVLKYKWRTGQAATMGKAKCDNLCFVVAVAVAETGCVIVHPGDGTAELFHLSDVADVFDIRHSMVQIVQKTCK